MNSGKEGRKVYHPMSVCLIYSLSTHWKSLVLQSVDAARALVRSQALRNSGIHYLEHEALRFKTPEGREWHVYASPVSVTKSLINYSSPEPQMKAAPYYARGAFQYMTYKEAEGDS